MPTPSARRRDVRQDEAPRRSVQHLAAPDAPNRTTEPSEAVQAVSGDVWEIFLGARYGPPRPAWVKVAGERVKIKRRRLELPPTKNDRLYWRVSRAWVKEWRQASADMARALRIPNLGRIRVSGVCYRTRLGQADAMNDLDRLHPLVDGLQDAGVIDNDNRRFLEHGTVTEERAGSDGPGILLVIERIACT